MIISIIGGGATGITILRHLAELAASERDNGAITGIQLFDKSGFDGGVAYRTQSDRHLLNMKPSRLETDRQTTRRNIRHKAPASPNSSSGRSRAPSLALFLSLC